jgi:hypothetical protein
MGDELRQGRASAAQELAAVAQATVADFQMRWARACAQLGALVAEAGVLGAALRTQVRTPAPYSPALSPDGLSMRVVFSGSIQPDSVSLPPEVTGIIARLDQLDDAMALIAGLGQAAELTQRHRALCQQRRVPSRMEGLYEVVRNFSYLGTEFARGMLVDRSVLPDGALYRFQLGRDLRVVEDAAQAA